MGSMMPEKLLRSALETAMAAGADYAEARAEETASERVVTRNAAVERLSSERDAGWGIHAYAAGGWGFASTSSMEPSDVRRTAERAVEIARASGTRRRTRSDLSLMPTWRGEYR